MNFRPAVPRALQAAVVMLLASAVAAGAAHAQGDATRGRYLAQAGGCVGCHTDETKDATPFAGGRALKTDFGTFYGPNITSDPKTGIGRWTEADFIRALRYGQHPDGSHYFPAFPYPSFTFISDADLRDLWAYLRSLPPSNRPSLEHKLRFPFGFRFMMPLWKRLFFMPGPFVPDARATPAINRGAYLVRALGHCGECHTPRNILGAMKRSRFLAGGKGPEAKDVPNITPTRLKQWSDQDLKDFLTSGVTPDGDVPAEAMAEVIRNTTSKLTPADLDALVTYLRSVPALPSTRKRK